VTPELSTGKPRVLKYIAVDPAVTDDPMVPGLAETGQVVRNRTPWSRNWVSSFCGVAYEVDSRWRVVVPAEVLTLRR
jgi:hypothetical protein